MKSSTVRVLGIVVIVLGFFIGVISCFDSPGLMPDSSYFFMPFLISVCVAIGMFIWAGSLKNQETQIEIQKKQQQQIYMNQQFPPQQQVTQPQNFDDNQGYFFCVKCGNRMAEGSLFCSKCGVAINTGAD